MRHRLAPRAHPDPPPARIFDLAINKPDVLYEKVVEVDERVTLVGYTSDPKRREREIRFTEDGKIERAYDGTEVEQGAPALVYLQQDV